MFERKDSQDSLFPDDMVLSYISRVLMEDDTEDKILCGNSDHPALLQVQETFAQILFSPSISANSDNTTHKCNMEGANNLLQGRNGNQCTLSSAFSKGEDAAGAFLKSIEEASRFLPKDNGIRKDQLVNQECVNHRVIKKRYNSDQQLEKLRGRYAGPGKL